VTYYPVDSVHTLIYNIFVDMKGLRFDTKKNEWLKNKRNITFIEIIDVIDKGNRLIIINHPNKTKYPKQKLYLVEINKYILVVPVIEEGDYIFMKTIYPSHKYTKKYVKNYKLSKKI